MYTLYFAYGSNLCTRQMNRRCPDFVVFETGILHGWRWLINTRGYATVVAEPSAEVQGAVYGLTDTDVATLDRHEGVAYGSYERHFLPVHMASGKEVNCLVYVDPIDKPGVPKPGYLDTVNRGANCHGIEIPDSAGTA